MKKILLLLAIVFLLFVSCDGGFILLGSSTVNVEVAPFLSPVEYDNDASRAVLPLFGQSVTLKVEAPDMKPMSKPLLQNLASKKYSGSLALPKGKQYTFTIEARDISGKAYVRGSATKTVVENLEQLEITLAPLNIPGDPVNDFFYKVLTGQDTIPSFATVSTVLFKPSLGSLDGVDLKEYGIDAEGRVPYSFMTIPDNTVELIVCDKAGRVLIGADKKWKMKEGDEVVIMYAPKVVLIGLVVAPSVIIDRFAGKNLTEIKEELGKLSL